MNRFFVLAATAALIFSIESYGSLVVGGITFDDNAFADIVFDYTEEAVFQSYTNDIFQRFDVSAQQALLGYDLRSSTIDLLSDQYVAVGFTDNLIFNGNGADFVIFETFSTIDPGKVVVEVGGFAIQQKGISLGYIDIGNVYNFVSKIEVDLTDYGFAENQTTNYIKAYGNYSEYAAFGAINNKNSESSNVPEPSTILLLLSAAPLAFLFKRKIN